MSKLFLCGNTGSMNRGCEAIVRSTAKIIGYRNGEIFLFTHSLEQDKGISVDTGIKVIPYGNYPTPVHRLIFGIWKKISKKSVLGQSIIQKPLFDRVDNETLCLNIGGDTYCYSRPVISIALNRYLHKKNIASILWCCSVEKDKMRGEILSDLKLYKYIFAREQITYNSLIEAGISADKVIKVCDPAFFLDTKEVELPIGFIENNTVGINLSEMTISAENPYVYDSAIGTIKYILEQTDMNVCLIPHVYSIKENKNDYPILKKVFDEVSSERVSIIDKEYTCEELKYIISKCRFFIGARTHSTIAAYSSEIPTLVIGYSVKSRGIAKDLFGTEDGYAISYKDISEKNELLTLFKGIVDNEIQIKERLHNFLPEYKKQLTLAIEKYIKPKEECKKGFKICDEEICSGCGACRNVCPVGAIEMSKNDEGFKYPKIDYEKCIECGKCRNICPVINVTPDTGILPEVYAVVHKDDEKRKKSSSGGAFTAFAEYILGEGGAVIGAGFDDKNNVVHKCIENIDDLDGLKGSKYVQSEIGNSYVQAKAFLEEGRKVLFVGTPCQIGGLLAYLGDKNYENLFTVDFICHGVPSPLVWRKYLMESEAKNGAKAKTVSFRNKNLGWQTYSMKIDYENGEEYVNLVNKDTYLLGFVGNLFLRPSCHLCSYKHIGRQSDITMGDFWGIEEFVPELSENKGVSIVMAHSKKARELLDSVSGNLEIYEQSIDNVLKKNTSLTASVKPSKLRKSFFKNLEKKSFDRLIHFYFGGGIISKINRKVRKLL